MSQSSLRDAYFERNRRRVTRETMTIHPVHLTTNLSSFGAISFSQMNSSVVVKITTVATVIVGGMDAHSHLCDRNIRFL
jgi:hypothetical protein